MSKAPLRSIRVETPRPARGAGVVVSPSIDLLRGVGLDAMLGLTETEPLSLSTRIETARAERQRLDAQVAERNADVRIDDPLSKVNTAELVSNFDRQRDDTLKTLSVLLLAETADLSAIPDVEAVLRGAVGESAELSSESARSLISRLHELRMVQELTRTLALEAEVRRHLLTRYIDREWGPRPPDPRPTVVRVETPANLSKPTPPPRRAAPGRENPPEREGAPAPTARGSRGGRGFNPFGNI